ncbi:MAG TPA: polyhydroxyalkanoic acid system family protein [Myxococcota bacterium]|jgi:hypothetical protein
MKHSVPHDLPFDLAKKAADAALQSYRTRFPDFDPQVSWSDDKTANVDLKAKGMSLKGVFEIEPNAITIDMEVPLLLRPFKQKAIDVIEQQIKDWIAKAKRGELS